MLARAEWIEDRQAELLNCQYFHVVFTVPEEIAAIAYQNKEVVYSILFRAAAETLRTIAADPKHRECPVCHQGSMIPVEVMADPGKGPAIGDSP